MSVTAHHGATAASGMHAAGVHGVDAFRLACGVSGAPRQVRLPMQAMDALVASNINYFAADGFVTAVWRALGMPCRTLSAKRAVRCELLRKLYARFDAKRPARFRPCAVEPVVRAALTAIVRDGGATRPLQVDAFVSRIDDELRRFRDGLLVMRGPLAAVRACVFTSLSTFCMWAAVAAFVTFYRPAGMVPLAHHAKHVMARIAGVAPLAGTAGIAIALAGERDRAQWSRSPGALGARSSWGVATLTLAVAALVAVLA